MLDLFEDFYFDLVSDCMPVEENDKKTPNGTVSVLSQEEIDQLVTAINVGNAKVAKK